MVTNCLFLQGSSNKTITTPLGMGHHLDMDVNTFSNSDKNNTISLKSQTFVEEEHSKEVKRKELSLILHEEIYKASF